MRAEPAGDVYTPSEIARATGVATEQVLDQLYSGRVPPDVTPDSIYLRHQDAVALGRMVLAATWTPRAGRAAPLFVELTLAGRAGSPGGVPLAVSLIVHAVGVGIAALIATMTVSPHAQLSRADAGRPDPMRLVFLSTPGPGGGGGGGGLRQQTPPPRAMREGRAPLSSPMPVRSVRRAIAARARPPEPPPVRAEPLPPVVAPVADVAADRSSRAGVLRQPTSGSDSRGPGMAGGVGSGRGAGLGEGEGPGIGPGSGGGTGGGPYRPGSGIQPPELLREVKADYTEDARRQNIEGDVVLEIVVARDGSVRDVKVVRGLGGGLNERAVEAVRQWRFAPARRLGTAVDVIVEASVEFRLR